MVVNANVQENINVEKCGRVHLRVIVKNKKKIGGVQVVAFSENIKREDIRLNLKDIDVGIKWVTFLKL